MGAETSNVCPRCGTRLHGAFLGNICPRCTLESAGAWAETPTSSTPISSPQSPHTWRVGARFGDYELIDVLGRGGMAVVYLARQMSLDRLVALKTILAPFAGDPHLQERFRREARAIAQLDHPRIVSIHDVGTTDGAMYYTMDYIAGPDLCGAMRERPIGVREAATIVQKVADAIEYAHERGVLHRDLKPGNILLDEQNEPHVTDFGIALDAQAAAGLTLPGDLLGTPAYMAPEALTGGPGKNTAATEVYALGAILFELLTGQPPFTGGSPSEVLHRALSASPHSPRRLNPAVPRELETICLRCLEKSAEARYASAGALAEDLRRFLAGEQTVARPVAAPIRWLRKERRRVTVCAVLALAAVLVFALVGQQQSSSGAASSERSIAVLPFDNLNHDPENAYFADGIQDEILTRLAKIDELKVISRSSTQRYKSPRGDLAEIAKQLRVAHILEGSVQKIGDQVRVNVQLIRAASDSHVWAETYDRKVADILAVESDIAENIAKALRAKLTPSEQRAVAARPTENAEAYDAYLRGLTLWNDVNYSPEALQKTADFFTRAVQLDPKFAQAWAILSTVQTLIHALSDLSPERLAEAKRALDTAFALQPEFGDAHFALGVYRYRGLLDYDGALEAFGEALARGTNKALCFEFSAYVKRRQGKWEEALALHAQSEKLDPLNVSVLSEWAHTYRSLRRFAEAQALLDRGLQIMPNNALLLAQRAECFHAVGDLQSAERVVTQLPFDPQQRTLVQVRCVQWAYTRRYGESIKALEGVLATPESVPKSLVAVYRLLLGCSRRFSGDHEGAASDLKQARAEFEALREQSRDGKGFLNELVLVYGMLGDKAAVDAAAGRLADRIATDGYEGPAYEQAVAQARAQLGEVDAVVEILERQLARPGGVALTRANLRLDPIWDPVRDDARFRRLCEEPKR